ncbi:hypothetical protein CFBP6411_02551 [Pseudomonas syringae group genomosp. 3]|uniref:Uncharacterized protein n=2 Tax=Pseudomonas syringae group TaxID=136849 RepID=A0AB38BZ91_PSESX|nr:hypothetical protein SAMN05444065_11845 [Pseudomonas syringae]SFO51473.1 hypothetical protein SAMN05444063_10845 [Pseudomonas syringae]SOS33908.1 hypothetical protein CFBP6411_02551 [Pseudomonas syringae group genomosp. 3]
MINGAGTGEMSTIPGAIQTTVATSIISLKERLDRLTQYRRGYGHA